MVKDGKALLGLSAVLAALLACQQVQLKIAPEGFTPSIAKEEISSATRQLTQEPVTPESAATWTQAVGSQLVQGANAVALPARVTLQGAFGVLLAPLGLRLRSLGQAATGSQAKAMAQACDLLKVTFQCPELYTLHAGEAYIQTLPVRPQRWAIFASSHLVQLASKSQLLALLLREVSLLRMKVPPLPQLWAFLTAFGNGKPRPHRVRSKQHQARHLARHFQELCRLHLGLSTLQARLDQLPNLLQPPLGKVTELQLPGVLGDGADVVGTYAQSGAMASLKEAGRRMEDNVERWQLVRIGRIAMLHQDVFGKDRQKLSLVKRARKTRVNLNRVYSIGPQRVEGLLEGAARVRHPQRMWQKRKSRRALFLSEIWASAASLSRGATMQADREAAEAIGGIDPVAGGLVLIHGTASQHRRLRRGELTGLIEDSQADFPTRRRWPFWFNAFVKAQMEPELVLRLAELADWADQAGLRKDTVWGRWKSWIWSWI